MGKIQIISLCNPCVMSVCGPNNVGRAVQTHPTLLCDALAITEQNKCWEWLAAKFDRFQTLRNNMQQGVETDATCNIQQCWELLANNVASVCTVLKHKKLIITAQISRAPILHSWSPNIPWKNVFFELFYKAVNF